MYFYVLLLYSIPSSTSEELKDLLCGLLKRNPADRMDFRTSTTSSLLSFVLNSCSLKLFVDNLLPKILIVLLLVSS